MTHSDVKTYRARTVQDALLMVERDLGQEAVILHTRQIDHRRWLPWQKKQEEVEVTASVGWSVATAHTTPDPHTTPNPPVSLETAPSAHRPAAHGDNETSSAPALGAIPPAGPASTFTRMPADLSAGLTDRLTALEEQLAQLTPAPGDREAMVPPELFDVYTELIDSELDEALARELVFSLKREAAPEDLADPSLCRARLVKMVEAEFETTEPIAPSPTGRRVVALVGPTGVGKTTTIAKLAANLKLRDGVRMGLVTVDTYRIAAVEQLRTYAEIIDLPMKVVTTPKEMRRALDELSDMDLVLIDTAGRSPRDDLQIRELKSLLAEAAVDEVQLVLSLTASLEQLASTVSRFASVGTSSLVFTKLDETHELGIMLGLARRVGLPVSYLTTGQDVPDDIEVADAQRMARLVLGQDRLLVAGCGPLEPSP